MSDNKNEKDKSKTDLSLLEEDDEFEEFPAENWTGKDEDDADVNVWEDNWDDDNVEDDFNIQLRAELEKQNAKPQKNGQSTVDAIDALVQDILAAFENKVFAWATFIDLSKAFDCVDHGILLHKLERFGIKNSALNVFRTYLFNRRQAVYAGGRWSTVAVSNCGVPQGSVLGPFLFLVAINDLPYCLNNKIYLYADDTTLLSCSSNHSIYEYAKPFFVNTTPPLFLGRL